MHIQVYGKPYAEWRCPVCKRQLRMKKVRVDGIFRVKTDFTDCRETLYSNLFEVGSYFKQINKLSLSIALPERKSYVTVSKDVTTAALLSVCKPDFLPTYTNNQTKITFPKQMFTYGPLLSMLVRPLQCAMLYNTVKNTPAYQKLRALLHQNRTKALCGKTPHSAELRSEVARSVVRLLWRNESRDAYANGFAMFISIVHSIGGIKALYAKYAVDSLQYSRPTEQPCPHRAARFCYNGMASFLDKYFVLNDDRVISTICKQFLGKGVQSPERFITASIFKPTRIQ